MISKGKRMRLSYSKNICIIKKKTSKHDGNFYCLNSLHSFSTKSKLEWHKTVCKNKYFFYVVIPSEDTKISEFN